MGGTRSTEGVRRARTDPAPVGVLNPQELESSLRTLVQGQQVWSLKRPFSWCHFPGQSSQVRWRMLMIQHPNYIVSSLSSNSPWLLFSLRKFESVSLQNKCSRITSWNMRIYFLGYPEETKIKKISSKSLKCGKGQPSSRPDLSHVELQSFKYSVQKSK